MSTFALAGKQESPEQWIAMIGLGLFGGLGHFALINALRAAPAATAAPFGYVNLLWATLVGYAIFGDLPDSWTPAGAAIVAGSGLYIARREKLRGAASAGG